MDFNWNTHPITVECFESYKERAPGMTAKHIFQGMIALHGLRNYDADLWQLTAEHILRLLHKFKANELAHILHVYERDMRDHKGTPYIGFSKKCEPEFYERIVSILPMQIPHMGEDKLVRILEIIVNKNLGSDRLFSNYLLMRIERIIFKFTITEYVRTVRALADKRYDNDPVFWKDFGFKYLYVGFDGKTPRALTANQSKKVWDAFNYLRMQCPNIDQTEAQA